MPNLPTLLVLGLALFVAPFQSPEANESYQKGRKAIDEQKWQEAIEAFERAAEDAKLTDAALFWQAYANAKIPDPGEALELIAELERRFPESSWRDDAQVLAGEIRGRSAPSVEDRTSADDELKLMALNGLVQADAEQAIPILEKILTSDGSVRLKERALFVLAQSDSEKAQAILAGIARGNDHPELQRKAIRYLGVHSSEKGLALLQSLYSSLTSTEARSAVLQSFMIAGDEAKLLSVAKNEPNSDLRAQAIHLLGTMGAEAELWDLFQRETSLDVKRQILKAFMISGEDEHLLSIAKDKAQPEELRSAAIRLLGAQGAQEALWQIYQQESSLEMKKQILHGLFVAGEEEKIAQVAQNASEPVELRKAAIHNLGISGDKAAPALVALYKTETSTELKSQVLHSLFIQQSAKELVEIARAEKDPELKKQAVHWISLMDSDEAKSFLMELLKL